MVASTCQVRDRKVVIVDPDDGRILWQGQPGGWPVWKGLAVPGSNDCLVLLEYWAQKQHGFENLLRIHPDGAIAWRAALPDPTDDAYVGMAWEDGVLVAGSWSGYKVTIDPSTGRILTRTFVK